MNLLRFIRKCVSDRPAARASARVLCRDYYGRVYWSLKPGTPLAYHLPTGGTLLLEPAHAFTGVFWPSVEHYEPDVRSFLNAALKPGHTFIDCGANVGYFSIQAGALVGAQGTVVAIEANPKTYKLLERNLKVNGFGIPVHCAITSEAGEVQLFMPHDWDIYSSLRADGLVEGRADHSFKVKGRTLDEVVRELGLTRVDLVKIDIEGGELDALRSAPHLLTHLRPFIITEYGVKTWASFGATSQQLKELVAAYDYRLRLFDPRTRQLVAVTDDVWGRPFANIALVPNERAELNP